MRRRARPVPRRSVEPSACWSSSESPLLYQVFTERQAARTIAGAGGRMKAGAGVLLAVVLLLSPWNVQAHHSFAAQYDANKPVTLVGTVTKVEWTNPHARFYVDVKDDKGVVTNWNLERDIAIVRCYDHW